MTTPQREDRVTKEANPANTVEQAQESRRRRIPMSTAERRLEVDAIPGYHLHWIRESRVPRAIDAGYELVDKREVHINNVHTYGSLRGAGGNTDLGSNVSVVADGSTGERLVLMKLHEADWQDDSGKIAHRNAQIMSMIFSGEVFVRPDGSMGPGNDSVYTKPLFNRPPRKIRLMGGASPNPMGLNARERP